MKFGNTLHELLEPEWIEHYIDYDELKRILYGGLPEDQVQGDSAARSDVVVPKPKRSAAPENARTGSSPAGASNDRAQREVLFRRTLRGYITARVDVHYHRVISAIIQGIADIEQAAQKLDEAKSLTVGAKRCRDESEELTLVSARGRLRTLATQVAADVQAARKFVVLNVVATVKAVKKANKVLNLNTMTPGEFLRGTWFYRGHGLAYAQEIVDTVLATFGTESPCVDSVCPPPPASASVCEECSRPVRTPLSLACGHCFCYTCVVSLLCEMNVPCPTCGTDIKYDAVELMTTSSSSNYVPGGGSFTMGGRHKKPFGIPAGVAEYSAYILDMDGVLHRSGTPIDGAADFVNILQRERVPYMLLTNECRFTNTALSARLHSILGTPIPEERIYTAANSVCDFFKRLLRHGYHKSVYVYGEDGLVSALHDAFAWPLKTMVRGSVIANGEALPPTAPPVGYVVIGSRFDCNTRFEERCMNYVNSGARLVYSCPDAFDRRPDGSLELGMPRSLIALIEEALGVQAYLLGKPNSHLLRMAFHHLFQETDDLTEKDVLFVGDSLQTDIRTALENGIDSALLMSGTTSRPKLQASALQPNFVFPSIRELHDEYVHLGHFLRESERITAGSVAEKE